MRGKEGHELGKMGEGEVEGKMMVRGAYEAEDGLERVMLEAWRERERKGQKHFSCTLPQSPHEYQRLIQALLYAILTQQQHQAQIDLTYLKAIVTDGYAALVHLLIKLVNECYPKLLEHAKRQLIWIFTQLVELQATDVQLLCLSLLRRIGGGDFTPPNLWLALEMVRILQSNWVWVTGNQGVLAGALFTYLCLLRDHLKLKGASFSVLKKTETELCVRILRERFEDCLCIGRELVRLLKDVACVVEFNLILKNLLANPGVVSQLYSSRTPVRYVVSRVTPEMEIQIRFMLTHVKWGNQIRYQAWFANRFLVAPESETLICDLIRFICCAHHPPNEILQSDVISRNQTDNIMNIEPAILVMVHSIPKYKDITQSLLEFLFLLMENFDPDRRELINRGVSASFEILIRKGVVQSLDPLLSCNLIAPSLREKLASYSVAVNTKIDHSIAVITETKMTEAATKTKIDCSVAEILGKKTTEVAMVSSREQSVFGLQLVGQSSASTKCPRGNQSHVPERRKIDSSHKNLDMASTEKIKRSRDDDVGDTVQQKRMCLDDVESTVQQHIKCSDDVVTAVQQKKMPVDESKNISVNNLLETAKRSDESAIDMLDKILMLFLGIPEQDVDGPVGGYNLSNLSADSSPEITGDLALRIENTLKVGGHEMFLPLTHTADGLERDEILSATSVVLRIYTLYQHPKLQEMLLFWHKTGLAVGPRLLSYASTLANELEQISGMKPIMDKCSLNQNLHGLDDLLTNAIQEEHGLTDINKGSVNSRSQRSQSLLKWQAQKYSLYACAKKATFSCVQLTENIGMEQFSIMVEEAFRAYKQFLVMTNISTPMPPVFDSNQNRMLLVEKLDGCLGNHEVLINQNASNALLKDLRILCLWSVRRLQQVFRSIFCYLSDLSTGKEGVIRLLVCFMVPAELLRFEIKLSLKEFSIFGQDPQNLCALIKSSVDWDFTEQQCFWHLLISELQVCQVPFMMTLLRFCADTLNPLVHAGTISGLLTFLRSQTPSAELLNAIVCLPKRFANFAASVIASWLVSKRSAVIPCLTDWTNACMDDIQTTNVGNGSCTEKLNLATIRALIHFLDSHDGDENMCSKSSTILCFPEIKASLLKLVSNIGFR
ncbi:uncharacterized protein LOC131038527 isoform X2 [Cryptomeria japonica]|uniref:uncharacterized protein LOC131038527 isoform X2 n=1 Tax=Cryptomeria japonica TaxID=3369 RepID=UPI0027D9E60E|nr:uncharacterized protein LOC131038527 isoform X2 [Cryptomeria japonica]